MILKTSAVSPISQVMQLSSGDYMLQYVFKKEAESIGNPAGIGQGTGFGLRDRDGIGLGHYRLRATENRCALQIQATMASQLNTK